MGMEFKYYNLSIGCGNETFITLSFKMGDLTVAHFSILSIHRSPYPEEPFKEGFEFFNYRLLFLFPATAES